jgi:hypothetical protein
MPPGQEVPVSLGQQCVMTGQLLGMYLHSLRHPESVAQAGLGPEWI